MNYDKYPTIKHDADPGSLRRGWDAIVNELSASVKGRGKRVLAVETYPGVDDAEIASAVRSLDPDLWIDTRSVLFAEDRIREAIEPVITDDRVFGRMYFGDLSDFQDPEKLRAAADAINNADGIVIVYGFGASEIAPSDVVVYADMARWEIQMRFRRGAPNYLTSNEKEDSLRKFKQGYFLEWRLADRIKRRLFERIDFYLDTNRAGAPVMITGPVLRGALGAAAKRPFRTVPYFDPGVWGGQWMKEVCGLDPDAKNFAWCFDGVPEENSLYFEINGTRLEIPASNLVFYKPKELLGPRVYARYGAEFPIRFDFLDTVGGQNLSLQVHPTTDYIHDKFGMSYTQDESYYILDAEEDACVYLGIKDGVDPSEMLGALREARDGGKPFDAEKYVNRFPAKKHDHFLIPAGTVHCSGKNCMVLEVSATPYIFTFKLWDWGRVGLDGKPRPIHLEHGERVIQWDRRTEWVRNNLVGQTVGAGSGDGFTVEKTGLHELEPIETKRYTVTGVLPMNTEDTVNVLNLVDGDSAVIESPTASFEPFEVHYAETFIIPAAVGEYTVRPTCGGMIKLLRATVKQ